MENGFFENLELTKTQLKWRSLQKLCLFTCFTHYHDLKSDGTISCTEPMFIYFYTNTVPIYCIHKHCVVYILYLMLGVFFSVLHPQFFTCFFVRLKSVKKILRYNWLHLQQLMNVMSFKCWLLVITVLFYELHLVFHLLHQTGEAWWTGSWSISVTSVFLFGPKNHWNCWLSLEH